MLKKIGFRDEVGDCIRILLGLDIKIAIMCKTEKDSKIDFFFKSHHLTKISKLLLLYLSVLI